MVVLKCLVFSTSDIVCWSVVLKSGLLTSDIVC